MQYSTSAPTPPLATTSCASSGVCLTTSRTCAAAVHAQAAHMSVLAAARHRAPFVWRIVASFLFLPPHFFHNCARVLMRCTHQCGCVLLHKLVRVTQACEALGEHLSLHHHLGQVHRVLGNVTKSTAHLQPPAQACATRLAPGPNTVRCRMQATTGKTTSCWLHHAHSHVTGALARSVMQHKEALRACTPPVS